MNKSPNNNPIKIDTNNSQINLFTFGTPLININNEKKLIDIDIYNYNQKILINKSNLNEWKIRINSVIKNQPMMMNLTQHYGSYGK